MTTLSGPLVSLRWTEAHVWLSVAEIGGHRLQDLVVAISILGLPTLAHCVGTSPDQDSECM